MRFRHRAFPGDQREGGEARGVRCSENSVKCEGGGGETFKAFISPFLPNNFLQLLSRHN